MIKIIATAVSVAAAGATFAGFGEVVSSFPHPGITGTAGLAWDGSNLWFAGEPSTLFVKTSTNGSIVGSFNRGGSYSYIMGLTYDGEYLWYSRHRLEQAIYYHQITTTGSSVTSFMYTWPYGDVGMTWEDGYLWCGAAKYTTAGSLVATFTPPFGFADLGCYGHKLWSGGPNKFMYNITTNGSVVASFPVPGDGNASGAAFDGQYLWLINPTNKYVYQVDIDVVGVGPASIGKVKALYR
jgi:hypothetical protein